MADSVHYPLVDWMSFTVSSPLDKTRTKPQWLDPLNVNLCRRQAIEQVRKVIGTPNMHTLFSTDTLAEAVGRFPYKYAVRDDITAAKIMWDPGLTHILVELSGKSCKGLQESGTVEGLCSVVSAGSSRIDVSVDIHTMADPVAFVDAGFSDAYRTHARYISDNGVTVYVGSPKSQRRAAVYRYKAPHPREEYLRVEHRFRGDSAKHLCNYVATNGLAMAVAYAGAYFGWKSPLWPQIELEVLPLPHLSVDAKDSHFARWLLQQVFPSMRRAEEQGRIEDLHAFVQTYLFEDDTF